MTELLFIIGVQKTATSTLLGVLNCHPEILLLYELFNGYPKYKSVHDKKYMDAVPELKSLSWKKNYTIKDCYSNSLNVFCKDNNYKYFGGKLVGLNNRIQKIYGNKLIYIVRDIRTWIKKDSIQSIYNVKKNRKNFTVISLDYVIQFLCTFKYKNCIRLYTEDIVCDMPAAISKIELFLKLDIHTHIDDWPNKIGKYKDHYKVISPNWRAHPTSLVYNKILDIKLEYNKNTNWDNILDIFDKYYNALDKQFNEKEINADVNKLKAIYKNKISHVSYNDVFELK